MLHSIPGTHVSSTTMRLYSRLPGVALRTVAGGYARLAAARPCGCLRSSFLHVFIRFSHSAIPRWLASRAQRDANQPRMESSMFSLVSRTLPFRVGWRPVHNGTPTNPEWRAPCFSRFPTPRHPATPTPRHPDTPTSRHPDIPTPRQHTHARTQTHTARVYKLGRPKNPG